MTADELLRGSFVSIEVNDTFSEAVLWMRDDSRLCFCHRVGERWARAVNATEGMGNTLADQLLAMISLFRLNAKHLDVHFSDRSRWETRFSGSPK